MRPHVLSRSPLTLVALLAIAAQASGQEMQLASRPRFLAVLPHSDRRVDASNAVILRRRVSIDLDGATVGTLLKEIARQADLELVYSEAIVPVSRPVTLHAQGITVAAAWPAGAWPRDGSPVMTEAWSRGWPGQFAGRGGCRWRAEVPGHLGRALPGRRRGTLDSVRIRSDPAG